MNRATVNFGRVLVFVAHPDDETIACAGLLQRAATSLVVFAVDGAPPYYKFEEQFGSLQRYSRIRFLEAARALSSIPRCSFCRLARQDGTWFVDQHLFLDLSEAFLSLRRIVCEFSPDLLVSHAFEGGHIDHDACHVLADWTARTLHLQSMEFPLYWRSERGQDVFQQFRQGSAEEFVSRLSPQESRVKRQMLAKYRTQRKLLSIFRPGTERFRSMIQDHYARTGWPDYAFENRPERLNAELLIRRIVEFWESAFTPLSRSAK
jgi:N-acetylglucosamine malate deacetylase 2